MVGKMTVGKVAVGKKTWRPFKCVKIILGTDIRLQANLNPTKLNFSCKDKYFNQMDA